MIMQILLNLAIALTWTFFQNDWSLPQFIIGYLIGIVLLGVFQYFWPYKFYLRKIGAILYLILLFLKELLISSFTVMGQIIRPKLDIQPVVFAYSTELESDWEVTVLSCLICLTPGTITLDVSHDKRVLYIHAMDVKDEASLSLQIKESFEKAIMEVTRS